MNTTQTHHKELIPFLDNSKKSRQDLQPFFDALESDVRPGVNDFSVPFHRTAFDYCDSEYIIIRHAGKQNVVNWTWSQYSGYRLELVSDIWFDEVSQEQSLMGVSEVNAHGHWEYDCNRGRFCSSSRKGIVKITLDGKQGFIRLSHYKSNRANPFFSEGPAFDSIDGDWHRDVNSGQTVINVMKAGTRMLLTMDGTVMPVGRNLKQELEEAVRMFKDSSDILNGWIRRGSPCAYRYGLSFRGAKAIPIPSAKAEELLPVYTFGKGFYHLCFELIGIPTLVFNEYSENDMW